MGKITWAQFKATMEEAGVKDDDQINRIDINGWDAGATGLVVHFEPSVGNTHEVFVDD